MIMTEAKAKECVCVGPEQCGRAVRDLSISPKIVTGPRLCITRECLAWRWVCTTKRTIYLDGDMLDQLPEDQWRGVCGSVDTFTKPFSETVDNLPKRSV